MTVKELIDELKKWPDYYDVYIEMHCEKWVVPSVDACGRMMMGVDTLEITDVYIGEACAVAIVNNEL